MTELDRIIEEYLEYNPGKKSKKSTDRSELEKQNRLVSENFRKLLKSFSRTTSGKKGLSQINRKYVKNSNYKTSEFNQRVILKATYKIQPNPAVARRSLKAHMKYIMREGTGNSRPFSQEQKSMDLEHVKLFPNDDNEKTFRFIISPEDAKMFCDDEEFKNYIQDIMAQLSVDLKIPELNWMAENHYNTDNPHCHVLLKGLSKEGKDVTIPKEYLKSGFRKMAEVIATSYLGTRSIADLKAAKYAEVDAERFTSIDSKLISCLENTVYTPLPSSKVCTKLEMEQTRLIQLRLHTLTKMGLVKQFGKSSYAVHPDLKVKLQAMPLEKDIIKKIASLAKKHGIDKNSHYIPKVDSPPITGTVIDKGYFDESAESKYIIVLDVNRQTHFVKLSKFSEVSGNESNLDDLVSISSKSTISNISQKEFISVMVEKISTLTLNEQIDYNGITYLDRIIANKAFVFENPNNYQQELSESAMKRINYLMSQKKLFNIENQFKFKKGFWDDGEVLEHGRVACDFQQVHKILQEGDTFYGKIIDTKVFQNGTHAIITNGKEFLVVPLKAKMMDLLNSGKKIEITKIKARRGYANPLYNFKLATTPSPELTRPVELADSSRETISSKQVAPGQPIMPKATPVKPPAQPRQEAAAKSAGQQLPSAFRESNDPHKQPAVEVKVDELRQHEPPPTVAVVESISGTPTPDQKSQLLKARDKKSKGVER